MSLSRRRFLGTSAVAAAAGQVGTQPSFGATSVQPAAPTADKGADRSPLGLRRRVDALSAGSKTPSPTFETSRDIAAAAIGSAGSSVNSVTTHGYGTAGDGGGGLYRYSAVEPRHEGKVQSLDGAWWELVPQAGEVLAAQFGAVPGAPAAAEAINNALALGVSVNLGGISHIVESPLFVPSSGGLVNGQLNFSGISAGNFIETVGGSLGPSYSLTADVSEGEKVLWISASDVSKFAAGDWIEVSSQEAWSALDGVALREIVQIKSVDGSGGALVLYGAMELTFAVSDRAVVRRLTTVDDIFLSDLTIVGAGDGSAAQSAARLDYALRPKIQRVVIRGVSTRGIVANICIAPRISDVEGHNINAPGLGYVVAAIGCTGGEITNIRGYDVRHVVTLGGTVGICVGLLISGIYGEGCLASVFDSHAAARDITVYGVRAVHPNYLPGEDALVIQGVNFRVDGCDLNALGARHGVLCQPRVTYEGDYSLSVRARVAKPDESGVVAQTPSAQLAALHLEVEVVDPGADGIYVFATNFDIRRVRISGNIRGVSGVGSECMLLRSSDRAEIGGGYVSVDCQRRDHDDDNLLLLGTPEHPIKNIAVTGILEKGRYGVNGLHVISGTVNTVGVRYSDMALSDENGI